MKIRQVVLEILRHGEAHNQLMSPLTRYLALCGSHPAVSFSIPFEHRELAHLLSRMRYEEGMDSSVASDRAFAREQLSRTVTRLLEQIPALPHEGRVDDGELLHLRLMTTPQELAILPFELANPPSGFSSGGQPLLIGPTPDVVLTREVRRSSNLHVRVPPKTRVLLAVADPSNRGLPFEATRDAIAHSLRPWVRPVVRGDTITGNLDAHLTVLDSASLDDIREHCASGNFTHVHILAHGAELKQDGQEGYGLALWDRRKEREEVVSGPLLARALRPPRDDSAWAGPWCVVLCTCESGDVGGVMHPTANLAHSLHVAGVPFVIASQYPLTFGAAIELAKTLYPLELRGEDPRRTLRDVRHAIATRMRDTHDWASLVAYAGWPDDVVQQLAAIRVIRVFAQLEAAQDWADHVIAHAGPGDSVDVDVIGRSVNLVEKASERLEREAAAKEQQLRDVYHRDERHEISKHERQHLLGNVTSLLTEIYGLLGSASKRRARLHEYGGDKSDAQSALRAAADWYLKGVALRAPEHWTACQSFVMLGMGVSAGWGGEKDKEYAHEQWRSAYETATHQRDDPGSQVWADSTLVEVEIWRPFFNDDKAVESAVEQAKKHLRGVIAGARPDRFPLKSTLRQLRRYTEWWGASEYLDKGVLARATEVLEAAPADESREEFEDRARLKIDLQDTLDATGDEVNVNKMLGPAEIVEVRADENDASDTVFRVRMLPARQGDALWVEYGSTDNVYRILIDGGFRTTIRTVENQIRELADAAENGKCHFELAVVSHIDADHIEGIIEILSASLPVSFGDFWFNGRRHLKVPAIEPGRDGSQLLGGKHGLFLDNALDQLNVGWNEMFDRKAICFDPRAKKLPKIELADNMTLTIMSPTPAKLDVLAKRWDKEVERAGLEGADAGDILDAMAKLHFRTGGLDDQLLGRSKPAGPIDIDKLLAVPDGADDTPANGSSIAFLAEHGGRSCLFMADAHPDVMITAIDKLAGKKKRLAVGAVKLSHHGSGNNVTLELLKRIDSRVFMVSTSGGGGHYHPDRHAIAKLVAGDWRPAGEEHAIKILFNYRSDYTEIWDDKVLRKKYNYSVEYADPGDILELSLVPKTPG
jgi:beta-lactamase superfamily II metal-dependent hydrolase